MKKEQINWLREEPVELQDITIKEFKPFPVEATDLDLDNEIADTIHYLARINVLGKEIERLNKVLIYLEKYFSEREYYEFAQLVRETKKTNIEWLEGAVKDYE